MTDSLSQVLRYFEQLSQIPRCSGHEAATREWLRQWAEARGWPVVSDEVGNARIDVPATPGCEDAPWLALQGHLDMVCEQTPEKGHDFARDPLTLVYEDEWLRADRTTLGADNGVAIAVAMALADDPTARHPALELLFTVDEETGLNGALGLQADFLRSRQLLNLDSEEDGVFIVGCAGGMMSLYTLPLPLAPLEPGLRGVTITVDGLRGGHSGIDIHRGRGNALRILGTVLQKLPSASLFFLDGGSAHNVIPRSARAKIAVDATDFDALSDLVAEQQAAWRSQCAGEAITIAWESMSLDQASDAAATLRVINLLTEIPHGVWRVFPDNPQLTETSSNLATARTEDGKIILFTSQRSADPEQLRPLSEKLRSLDPSCAHEQGYPGWKPDWNSPLLALGQQVHRDLFNREPRVEVIHAGLECGVIGDRIPGMDMLSCGPTIENAHSPQERMHLPSLERMYQLVLAMCAKLADVRAQ